MRTFYLVYADSNYANIVAIYANRVDADTHAATGAYDVAEVSFPYMLVVTRTTIPL